VDCSYVFVQKCEKRRVRERKKERKKEGKKERERESVECSEWNLMIVFICLGDGHCVGN